MEWIHVITKSYFCSIWLNCVLSHSEDSSRQKIAICIRGPHNHGFPITYEECYTGSNWLSWFCLTLLGRANTWWAVCLEAIPSVAGMVSGFRVQFQVAKESHDTKLYDTLHYSQISCMVCWPTTNYYELIEICSWPETKFSSQNGFASMHWVSCQRPKPDWPLESEGQDTPHFTTKLQRGIELEVQTQLRIPDPTLRNTQFKKNPKTWQL